jgi:hypothetical protein
MLLLILNLLLAPLCYRILKNENSTTIFLCFIVTERCVLFPLKKYKLHVSENKALRSMFGPKR